MSTRERFDRQIRLFGKGGQKRIRQARPVVVGLGGIGSHVAQQLAFLGVGAIAFVDPDELGKSNLNRLVGAYHGDLIPGTKKVDIAARLVRSIDATIEVATLAKDLRTEDAFSQIKQSTHIFGCVDGDGARLVLNELAAAYDIPYVDSATDVDTGGEVLRYGGRVFVCADGNGCLSCYDLISHSDARLELGSPADQRNHERIYGIPVKELDQTGPSVVSINGVVASLAVTEFALLVTGLRPPHRLLTYRADMGTVNVNTDPPPDCFYCKQLHGMRDRANVDRYL